MFPLLGSVVLVLQWQAGERPLTLHSLLMEEAGGSQGSVREGMTFSGSAQPQWLAPKRARRPGPCQDWQVPPEKMARCKASISVEVFYARLQ